MQTKRKFIIRWVFSLAEGGRVLVYIYIYKYNGKWPTIYIRVLCFSKTKVKDNHEYKLMHAQAIRKTQNEKRPKLGFYNIYNLNCMV